MSKVLNKSISLFLISASLLFSGFTAIAEELPLPLGKHLFAQGNYDATITEYKRFLFFHPDDARVSEVYHNIGLAYRAQGLWTEAVTSLRAATHLATDDEAKSEYQLELAVTLIAAQDYDLARLELIKVTMRALFRAVVPTRTFLASRCVYLSVSMGGCPRITAKLYYR